MIGRIFKLKQCLIFTFLLFLILFLSIVCMGKMTIKLFPDIQFFLRTMATMTEGSLICRHPFFLIRCSIHDVNKYIVVFLTLIFRKELQSFAGFNTRIELHERNGGFFACD